MIGFINEEIIAKHGVPENLVSDNGTQFTSNAFKDFIDKIGIRQAKTADYHPSANGMDERLNGTLVKILRNYIDRNQMDWDRRVPWALFLYNSTRNESTKLTPYSIMFGREARLPLAKPEALGCSLKQLSHEELRKGIDEMALANTQHAQEQHKRYYDSHRVPQNFRLFDLVMARSHAPARGDSKKLSHKWEGPYIIMKMIQFGEQDPVAVELYDAATHKVRRSSFQDLKLFIQVEEELQENDELPGHIMMRIADENADQLTPQPGTTDTFGVARMQPDANILPVPNKRVENNNMNLFDLPYTIPHYLDFPHFDPASHDPQISSICSPSMSTLTAPPEEIRANTGAEHATKDTNTLITDLTSSALPALGYPPGCESARLDSSCLSPPIDVRRTRGNPMLEPPEGQNGLPVLAPQEPQESLKENDKNDLMSGPADNENSLPGHESQGLASSCPSPPSKRPRTSGNLHRLLPEEQDSLPSPVPREEQNNSEKDTDNSQLLGTEAISECEDNLEPSAHEHANPPVERRNVENQSFDIPPPESREAPAKKILASSLINTTNETNQENGGAIAK